MPKAVSTLSRKAFEGALLALVTGVVVWVLNNASANTKQEIASAVAAAKESALKEKLDLMNMQIKSLETARDAHNVMLNSVHTEVLGSLTQINYKLGRIEEKVGIVQLPLGPVYAGPTERGY